MAQFEGKLNLNVETSEIEINGKFKLSEEELSKVAGGQGYEVPVSQTPVFQVDPVQLDPTSTVQTTRYEFCHYCNSNRAIDVASQSIIFEDITDPSCAHAWLCSTGVTTLSPGLPTIGPGL